LATPEPPVSLDARLTLTGLLRYQAAEQAAPLHAILVSGGTVSDDAPNWIDCARVGSTLPVLSFEKNFTVVVDATVNEPVYATAAVLLAGSDPSVV
jgi:hypothetical protein